MGRASKTCIAAIAIVLALAVPAHARYDPTAFHPFEADQPVVCNADIVGTDGAESLQGGATTVDGSAQGLGVLGMGGNDTIAGDPRTGECMRGGAGDDRIRGGSERNSIDAGPGADEISSANGIAEHIRCGSGRDVIWADRADRLSGCEHVHLVRNPWPAVTPHRGANQTRFHLTFRSPFSTDDPCDCVGFFVQQTARPAGAGCGRTDLTGWLYPSYGRRSVSPITSLRRGGLCRGVYGGEVSFRMDYVDDCQTIRAARHADRGDLTACDLRIGIGSFSFRVR